ncbi:MAG: prolyl oligopeptidase family serine peptidase [Armatimonadetes bacterium]|nr:prolyl oligopeptidase family serine peptidase [Armatimonadota bacterium]
MAKRNFSMIEYFNRIAADWEPLLTFKGTTLADFEDWQARASEKFFELLGEFPRPVDPEPEVIFSVEEDGLIRERVIFDSEEFMSVPCVVLRPVDMKADGSNPAILCSHGHGAYGKEPVAGNRTTPDLAANIAQHNYNYGEIMARAGYLTLSPDLRVFGERADGGNPYPGRDKCNVHFLRGAMFGIYTLTLNIWDMKCCVDYLQSRPEVDGERIGMMGLSQGGTMTTFATAAEPRIKCADIIGYLNPWEKFAINRANWCGSQMVPGIYKYFDVHDIAGLIAPRPLLIEMGVHDTCFFIEDQLASWERLQEIYRAAGAEADLWCDIHPGEHMFANNKAHEFFGKYL